MIDRPPQSKAITVTAVLLLILMGLLMGGSIQRESITVDERGGRVAHI